MTETKYHKGKEHKTQNNGKDTQTRTQGTTHTHTHTHTLDTVVLFCFILCRILAACSIFKDSLIC